jgi:hypothetical protein
MVFVRPVTVADRIAQISPQLLPTLDHADPAPNLLHGTDHYVYPGSRARKVITIHDLTFLKYPHYATAIVQTYRARIQRCLSWSDGVITFADSTKQDIIDYIINDTKIMCEHPSVTFRHGAQGNKDIIIYSGTMTDAVKAFSMTVHDAYLEKEDSQKTVWVVVSGGYCGQKNSAGKADAVSCDIPLVWNMMTRSFDLAPLYQARFIDRNL